MRRQLATMACATSMIMGAAEVGAQTAMSDAELNALMTAAKAEGALMIYSGANVDQLERYIANFKKSYGIEAQMVRLTGAQTTQRFATEAVAGVTQADIVGTSESTYFDGNPKWFMDISQPRLPNYVAWPADSKSPYRATISRGILGLLYNTDLVPKAQAPKVWKDVLDRKWRGKIIMSDPQISVNWGGWLKATHDKLGEPFVKELATQNFQVVASTATGAQQVAAGAKALNFPTAASFAISLQTQGAPIEYVFMAEPTVVNRFNFGAAAAAPHPNAAKLFMHWLLSPEGITATCTNNIVMSPGDPEGKLGCMARPQGELVDVPDSLNDRDMRPLFDTLKLK